MISARRRSAGFSLVELALVLVIVAILVGGLVLPLASQVEQRRITETQKALAEIREALMGFAIINGYLPCPSTQNDPANAAYGVADTSCQTAPTAEGFLPWKTLGVGELDAWGSRRRAAADPRLGDFRYRVDRNFANSATLIKVSPPTAFADSLTVRDNAGNSLTTTSEYAVAIVFSAGPNRTPDGQHAPASFDNIYQAGERTNTFDDLTVWIGRPSLFSRLVSSGRPL